MNSWTTPRKTSRKKTEKDHPATPFLHSKEKPLLLLHICCGPCSVHVIDLLKNEYHPIGFFYNPNIHPREEYARRLESVVRVSQRHATGLWVPPLRPETWTRLVYGLENEPEGGRRCNICIRHRLEVTAKMAKAASIPVMATTLTVGPQKKSKEINMLGLELAESHRIAFLEADFKKRDGFLKSLKKSRSLGLYRQDYCGCCFSMRKR